MRSRTTPVEVHVPDNRPRRPNRTSATHSGRIEASRAVRVNLSTGSGKDDHQRLARRITVAVREVNADTVQEIHECRDDRSPRTAHPAAMPSANVIPKLSPPSIRRAQHLTRGQVSGVSLPHRLDRRNARLRCSRSIAPAHHDQGSRPGPACEDRRPGVEAAGHPALSRDLADRGTPPERQPVARRARYEPTSEGVRDRSLASDRRLPQWPTGRCADS